LPDAVKAGCGRAAKLLGFLTLQGFGFEFFVMFGLVQGGLAEQLLYGGHAAQCGGGREHVGQRHRLRQNQAADLPKRQQREQAR